jgi:hypothetical protein
MNVYYETQNIIGHYPTSNYPDESKGSDIIDNDLYIDQILDAIDIYNKFVLKYSELIDMLNKYNNNMSNNDEIKFKKYFEIIDKKKENFIFLNEMEIINLLDALKINIDAIMDFYTNVKNNMTRHKFEVVNFKNIDDLEKEMIRKIKLS